MNPRALELGPDEPQEWPCQNCTDGQVPAGKFAKHNTRDCDECDGTGVIEIDPDEFLDPNPDPIDLSGEVDFR